MTRPNRAALVSVNGSLIGPAPELYTLTLSIAEMPHRDGLYKNVHMELFRCDMPPHDIDYSRFVVGSPAAAGQPWGDFEYNHEFINKLFTLKEAHEVEAYFRRHPYRGTVTCPI
jgi:hypothetical protein